MHYPRIPQPRFVPEVALLVLHLQIFPEPPFFDAIKIE